MAEVLAVTRSERRFPVLDQRQRRERNTCPWPESVPWGLLAPHERMARRNHDQTLERLAERGGLSILEMLVIIEDRCWSSINESGDQMLERLLGYVAKYERVTPASPDPEEP